LGLLGLARAIRVGAELLQEGAVLGLSGKCRFGLLLLRLHHQFRRDIGVKIFVLCSWLEMQAKGFGQQYLQNGPDLGRHSDRRSAQESWFEPG
jgi:hypothetical protein